jgi:hypothetical protein
MGAVMRVFKTRYFSRWARSENLSDKVLKVAIEELANGLHDGSLGASCFKKRISLSSRGKRGGARTIVAFRSNNHSFFIYGYPKNKRANISRNEEMQFKKLGKIYLNASESDIKILTNLGEIVEVI